MKATSTWCFNELVLQFQVSVSNFTNCNRHQRDNRLTLFSQDSDTKVLVHLRVG